MATCKAKIISRMYRVFDSRGIKSADLKGEFLFQAFGAFCVTMMYRNATDCHVRMLWLGRLKCRKTGLDTSAISINVSKMFAKSVP